jgi:Zn-dependent membrane protease YugP
MSDVDDRLKLRMGVLLIMLLRMGAQGLYGKAVTGALKQGKKLPDADIKRVLQAVGAPPMPVKRYPGLDNAFYAPPMMAKNPLLLSPAEMKRAEKVGYIAYDPALASEAIMGHEAGHAQIRNRKWNSLRRMNQGPGRMMGGLVSALSVLPGIAVAGRSGNIGLPSYLTAAGVSALGNIPKLINEYQASSLGMEGLDKLYGKDDLKEHVAARRRKRNGRALRAALSTYAVGTALDAASSAGMLGLIKTIYG